MTAFTRRFAVFLFGLLLSAAAVAASTYVVDGDGDAISDEIDDCPYTHPGVRVDASGCPLSREDGDLDGVADESDDCPYSTAGAMVDAKGCALDSDFDGVANGIDRCPRTALALPVNAKGCASDERAEAGVAQQAQAQSVPAPQPLRELPPEPVVEPLLPPVVAALPPTEPAPRASPPLIALPLPATAPVVAAAAETPELLLKFKPNSARLSDSDLALVESYARIFSRRLAANTALKLNITAYADQGEVEVAGLVLARAAIVRAALLQKGIASETMHTRSGVLRDGDASRNRRVQVKLDDARF